MAGSSTNPLQNTISNADKTISKAEMLEALLPSVPDIVGEPTPKEMIHTLLYLINCAQSHQVPNNNGLNVLHICLPAALYAFFVMDPANQQYLQRAQDPGNVPAHNTAGNAMIWSNANLEWECRKILCQNKNNMDRALVKSFKAGTR